MAFETFLKEVGDLVPQKTADADVRPSSSGTPRASARTLILAMLTERSPMLLPDLQKATGLGFTDFSDAVTALHEAGLVEISGESGEESVRLSPQLSAAAS